MDAVRVLKLVMLGKEGCAGAGVELKGHMDSVIHLGS